MIIINSSPNSIVLFSHLIVQCPLFNLDNRAHRTCSYHLSSKGILPMLEVPINPILSPSPPP